MSKHEQYKKNPLKRLVSEMTPPPLEKFQTDAEFSPDGFPKPVIIQKTVDSIIRMSESGQKWLEPDVSDSESDGALEVMIFCRYLWLQIV